MCAVKEDLYQIEAKGAHHPCFCPDCRVQVSERLHVRVPAVNEDDEYCRTLYNANKSLETVLIDVCKNCVTIAPITYPLITNPRDVDMYLSMTTDELKNIVQKAKTDVSNDAE